MGKTALTRDLDSFGVEVVVKLPDGQAITITLHQCDQIAKVYNVASTRTGARESLIRIKYAGKVLGRSQKVSYLGLMSGMVLKTEVITPRSLDLVVRVEDATGSDDKMESMQAMNTDTVRQIQQLLVAKGYEEYTIYLGNKKLPVSEEMLHDLKIGNNSTLIAKPKQSTAAAVNNTKAAAVAAAQQNESEAEAPTFTADGKSVEVVFSFDTTGSMFAVLTKVRSELQDMVDRLIADIPNIRIGLIAQGDYCDHKQYVVRTHELSSDAESLKKFAMNVPATTGGDSPEAYELVLRRAQEMDWSEDSAKALVVIGDCEPHPPSMTDQQLYWHTELDVLSGLGIKVYGVQACNNSIATPFYKELADRTNGAYVTFSNFSLIKQMFLAVCYNEASEEQLNEFRNELEAHGNLSTQQEQIFTQLQEQQQAVREDRAADILSLQIAFDPRQSKNYVSKPWFDKSLDLGKPQYSYNSKNNSWGPYQSDKSSNRDSSSSDISLSAIVVKASLKRHNKRRAGFLNCFS